MSNQLPTWMNSTNEYTPQKDNNGFLTKSMLEFFKLFRHFHVEKNESISQTRAGFRLLMVLGLVVLIAQSHNLFFIGSVAAGFLLFLSFTRIDVVKRVLSTGFTVALFTVLIMLPAYFMYHSYAFIYISGKVFLSVGIISMFAQLTPWNKITGALRFIKIPSFVIFILDLTIHYILILGNIAYEMLFALQLRSVGKNKTKEKSFSGILGTVFLKSMSFAEETQQAMECRLFNGDYVSKKMKVSIKDFIPIFVLVVYILIFIFV